MSSVIDTLIIDRTEADVNKAISLGDKLDKGTATESEVAEWLGNALRGKYNYTDLNRISDSMHYLAARFNQYGYYVTVSSKQDWVATDTPTATSMETYIRDLKALRGTFNVLNSTPEAPGTMDLITWQTANAIEQILTDIETVIQRIEASFPRSGSFVFYSGNRPLPV